MLRADSYFRVFFGSAPGTNVLPSPKHAGHDTATPTGGRPIPRHASQSAREAIFPSPPSACASHCLPLHAVHWTLPLVRPQLQSTSLCTPLPRHSRHITVPPPFSNVPLPSHF